MKEVVINTSWGGFRISYAAAQYMAERGSCAAQHELDVYHNNIETEKARIRAKIKDIEDKLNDYDIQLPLFNELDSYYADEAAQALYDKLQRSQDELDSPLVYWHGFGYSPCTPDGYVRHDPLLIDAVKTLGKIANEGSAELEIVFADDYYKIEDYDGKERL